MPNDPNEGSHWPSWHAVHQTAAHDRRFDSTHLQLGAELVSQTLPISNGKKPYFRDN